MNAQILEFDTNLAGFKVAKILPSKLDELGLSNLLAELKQQDVRLVYWLIDSNDAQANQAAINNHGLLVSQQVAYLTDLTSLNYESRHDDTEKHPVELYQDSQVSHELEQLALAAGSYSRFKMDSKLPQELFFKLYHEWIKRSVNKSYASDIITIKDHDKIVAMTTLGAKNNRGDIGLLAVDANFRGKNFGTKMVVAAQLYFISQGFTLAQVVTQGANTPARHLYEKCGFKSEKSENCYHFWLS